MPRKLLYMCQVYWPLFSCETSIPRKFLYICQVYWPLFHAEGVSLYVSGIFASI